MFRFWYDTLIIDGTPQELRGMRATPSLFRVLQVPPALGRTFTDADLGTLGFVKCLRETGMPIEKLRRYGELCRDETTVPDRVALLEEHAAAVQHELDALLAQQARLAEKLAWYRAELAARQAAEISS